LIAIVWDEANFYTTSPYHDSRACCNEVNQPGATGLPDIAGQVHVPLFGTINVKNGTNRLLVGTRDSAAGVLASLKLLFTDPKDALSMRPGGGDSGAILLSPFIKPGTVSKVDYNHFSLLATIQNIFGVRRPASAADPLVRPIGADVFNNVPAAKHGAAHVSP
jgi:Phosphoesterase family